MTELGDSFRKHRDRKQSYRSTLWGCICSGRKLYPEQKECPDCGRDNPQYQPQRRPKK